MNICISPGPMELGTAAAKAVAGILNDAIKERGKARLLVSTGSSQFETLQALVTADVDWSKVELFHLDEYIDLPLTHKASFVKYLKERFVDLVNISKFHYVDVTGDINDKIKKLSAEIGKELVDVGLIGIGENAHIAFNDPPADFETRAAYKIVTLDQQCKMQQVNEGWFPSLDKVPDRAVSMTVWQIMQCKTIISCVPHKAKAAAVYKTLSCRLGSDVPSTMLKQHYNFHLYLDYHSASEVVVFEKPNH
jgi:glucosamine-6-phosphate deaminase